MNPNYLLVYVAILIKKKSGFQLTTTQNQATAGENFTFICNTNEKVVTFSKNGRIYCSTSYNENKCDLDISTCPSTITNTCSNSQHTMTLPGSLINNILHGSKWKCASPFGIGNPSNEIELHVNIPITQVNIEATPIDGNPVEIVTGKKQRFQCKTDAGRPSSKIQWYISGTNITSFASPQDDVCSLNCNDKVISSSVLTYTGNREDEGKIIYCIALNIENQSVGSHNKSIKILYGPNQVIIYPSTRIYTISETTGHVGPITCSADCKPACTITWSRPNLPDKNASVLSLRNVERNQEGNYQCSCANIVGNLTSVKILVVVEYGPRNIDISPSTQMYNVTETSGSVGPIKCSADCKPECTMTWSGSNIPTGTTSILNIKNIEKNQTGSYQCNGTNSIGSLKSVTVFVNVNYGPNKVNISPSTQTYTLTETTGRVGPITCSADCKPYCTMTWNGPNLPAGTTHVLNLKNIDRNQAGNYQCIGGNFVGNRTSFTISVIVHYGPRQLNIYPLTPIYTVTETNTSVGPITCSADCKPDCSLTWSGPTIPNGTTSVINLKHIAQTQAGNYQCSATNNIGSLTLVKFIVIFHYKPFLDHSRPYSSEYIIVTENNTLHIKISINANPIPTIEWTFQAKADMMPCNFSTIVSNTSTNGFSSFSFILIDNVQYSNFGEYVISARNTIGVFYRRFIVINKASFRKSMSTHTQENTSILVAGMVTLSTGLLSLTATIICIVRQRCRNKASKSCKSAEYTDVHRSNPAFTDVYTTLQSDIETSPHQEQCGNTYDECRAKPEEYACSSLEKNESEQEQHQEKGINTYEECGTIFDAKSYGNLII